MQHSQLLQGWQKSQNGQIALYAPRTWLVSLSTFVISSLLMAAMLALLHAVSLTLFASLFSKLFGGIVIIPLLLFFFSLFFVLFTNRTYKIKAYRKALKKYLETSINGYYSPEGALAVQEHLATIMSGNGLQQEQKRHLLVLGGPGSGKTANLKYAVYQAVSSDLRKTNKLPVLIQMKYYNGFLRNLRVASPVPSETPTETLLAYLLDDEHEQKSQAGKETELVGLNQLHSYLPQLLVQGRIVFLCDGMNELESDALAIIHGELTHLMQTTQNSVVMTCRELEYQEQELLKDLANNGAAIKMLPPLTEKDIAEIIKTYLQGQRMPGQVPLSYAEIEAAQEQIRRLSQSDRETSPFVLIMLIQALKNPEILARPISRGRLLRLSVDQRSFIHESAALIFGDHPDTQNVKDFLSAVACTARRNGQRNAVQLVKDTKFTTSSQLQDFLNVWLSDNEVDVGNFTQANIGKFLRIALDAGLITISNNGVLSFIHELIAEYFAAEYLRFIYRRKDPEDEAFWHSIYESEVHAAGLWSEPIAIWAGLEDQPIEIARFLMTNIDYYCLQKGMDETETDFYHYHALALSLGCLGVRASDGLPDETLSYLKQSVLVKERHEQLAMIFKRCADEGGIGVYQALLPYIHVPGLLEVFLKIHDLYNEKGNSTILAMLFEYMEKVAAIPTYADQTQALITLLGEIGRRGDETVRLRARHLSGASRPPLLRAAAINILELLRNPNDVALLIGFLYTSDKEVIGPAISAVRIFGPEFTLAILEREETKLQNQAYAQTRLNFLRVLEGFLETNPQALLIVPRYMQTLVSLIVRFLSAFDKEPTWLLAQNLLNRQMQKSPEDASMVTIYLLDVIDTEDQKQAEHIQELLEKNCLRVLETITDYWKTRKRREVAWERIITVLGKVSDKSILEFLLQQLDESATSMQNELSTALSSQQESTDPLLQAILAPTATQNVIRVAGNALRQTGEGCITSICDEFLSIRSHADATDAGLKCLIDLLDELRKDGIISARTEGGTIRALITLFKWLIEDAHIHAQLAAEMIPVMVGFLDPQIVLTLLEVLVRSGVLLEKVYEEAIKGLSQLGEYAVDYLIEALDSPKETHLTKRVRQVLLEMEPFPRVKLLSAFTSTRSVVVQQVMWIFIANQHEPEIIRFLVKRLLESRDDHPLFDNIQQTLTEMQPNYTMPYLIEALGQPNWRVIKPLLRACPQPEIILPLLVKDLTDLQRYILVLEVLREEFDYPTVLPWLVSGLGNSDTRQHTRQLIEKMAHTYDGDLLPDIVRLFNPAIAQPEPLLDPLPEVQRTLQELLTTELAQDSLPALVMGLGEPPVRESCTDSLVTLAHIEQRQEQVLQAVSEALRNPSQRLGAHNTLVKCGQIAAQSVFELVRENDDDLVREARTILAEMGETAFPYIYQLAHDPQHRAHAEDIFQHIPPEIISKGLLACFASNDRQKEEAAFYLLTMGMNDKNGSRPGSSGLTSALLAQALEYSNSDVCLRTLSALLFFSHGRRSEIAQQIVSALTQTSEEHFCTEYMRILFLLGKDAVDPLGFAMHTPDLPERVRLEMISTLSILAEDEQVTEYVKILTAGPNGMHRALGLRALGGLLVGGIYDEKKLEEVRKDLSASSKSQDRAAFEFFDVLLGTRSLPEIIRLQEVVNGQQDDIDRLNKLIRQQEEELVQAHRRAEQAETGVMSLQKQLNRR
ncbi:MAG TPA: hypothetical protein VGL94_11545 [Ktedonobacteraceae bacterium]